MVKGSNILLVSQQNTLYLSKATFDVNQSLFVFTLGITNIRKGRRRGNKQATMLNSKKCLCGKSAGNSFLEDIIRYLIDTVGFSQSNFHFWQPGYPN